MQFMKRKCFTVILSAQVMMSLALFPARSMRAADSGKNNGNNAPQRQTEAQKLEDADRARKAQEDKDRKAREEQQRKDQEERDRKERERKEQENRKKDDNQGGKNDGKHDGKDDDDDGKDDHGDHRKVTICHKGHTLHIARSALRAHLKHGDTLGPCNITPHKNR
jgi:hypothetical protein